jgi:hypothetical protein
LQKPLSLYLSLKKDLYDDHNSSTKSAFDPESPETKLTRQFVVVLQV